MMHKILIVVIALIIIVLAIIALTDNTMFLNERNIVLVGYSKYSQKWIDIKEGALSSGQKQGINLTAVASDSIHAVNDQIELIEQAIDEKPDAIIIMPTDLSQLSDVIEKVIYNNIDLIIIDNYEHNQDYDIPRVGIDINTLSVDLASVISESKNNEIKVGCIFTYEDNGKSSAIYNEFAKIIRDYNNIVIIEERISATDENVAAAATEVMLNTYKLDYIVCFEETITKGAGEYLYKQIESGNIGLDTSPSIIGIGSVDDCVFFLEENIISSLCIQSYYNMGYLAVQNYGESYLTSFYAAHFIVQKEDLMKEEYQKILFRID